MDDAFLEHLLNEEESASLDFKRDQYLFVGATDEQKAELLKDILAFANAWRRDTAYILIGVEEIRGGRSNPVGVHGHLNDADVQQFVNAKTNRPIMFRYMAYPFQGLQLGVLQIPTQTRPLYLTKRFAGLAENVAYVRRGSSTAVATPDELARMGSSDAEISRPTPTLAVEWGEPHSRRLLGGMAHIAVEVLNPPLRPSLIPFPAVILPLAQPHHDYADQLVTYTYESNMVRPLFVVIHNRGQVPAHGVTLNGNIAKADGLRLHDWPLRRPTALGFDPGAIRVRSPVPGPTTDVDAHADHWTLAVAFGTLRPGQTIWSENPVYVGADHSDRIDLPLQIMAENIPVPLDVMLSVEVSATVRAMQLEDTRDLEEY